MDADRIKRAHYSEACWQATGAALHLDQAAPRPAEARKMLLKALAELEAASRVSDT